ncbi:MAG: DNA polymerase III subunit gamma/tau [Balneola sp.]|nr:MAG: DNA polymerase III subunit gamma/tau [Balneola sp.]
MSEHYRALTRKYRPNSFEDIVSQDHVSSTLLNAIKQKRLSHAYMFCGPRGVGKTTMARVLARVINEIDTSVDGEALNQTLNIIEMDAASNNKVEDVHHLRESVRIPPQNGRYKVFIVDEVHMLSKAAFNALLKTLEEPPEHAIFIFATTEPHKVLPTILSRVQRFDFKRISVEEIVARLRKISLDEQIAIDEESLHVIAKKADGALRDALGLMDQAIAFCGDTITHNELLLALNVVGTDRLFQFMDCVKEHDANAGLDLINTLLQEGYDIQEFLIGLTEHLRNLYIAHHSPQLYLVEASDETRKKYQATAPGFSRDDLMRMMHIVSEAQIKLKDASQPRVQFEITLLKLIHMERSESLKQLLSDLEEVKKKFKSGASSSSSSIKQEAHQQIIESQKPVQEALNGIHKEEEAPENPIVQEKPVSYSPKPDEQEPVPVLDEYDLGQPALVTEVTQKAKVLHFKNGNGAIEKKEQSPVPAQETVVKLTLEKVHEIWSDFLSSLENNVPKTLELQVQRVTLSSLSGNELTIECENAFAAKMMNEQAHDLCVKLKEHVGTMLRFKTVVKKGEVQKTSSLSNYDRFKEIQQKDPIVRELVTRLGAELEF